jgi:hypothetical protein
MNRNGAGGAGGDLRFFFFLVFSFFSSFLVGGGGCSGHEIFNASIPLVDLEKKKAKGIKSKYGI